MRFVCLFTVFVCCVCELLCDVVWSALFCCLLSAVVCLCVALLFKCVWVFCVRSNV